MYYVLHKFKIADRCCIDVAGDTQYLKNGIKLKDEKENIFVVVKLYVFRFIFYYISVSILESNYNWIS